MTTPLNLSGLIRNSGRSFSRGLLSRSLTGQVGRQRVIQIELRQIIPATVASLALLYKQGEESVKPDGQRGFWARVLAESGISYFVIDNTKGVFPLWGMLLGTYRAGQKKNLRDQVKAVMDTVIAMSLGFVGVHLGAGVSEAANEIEEREISRLLNEPVLQKWVDKLKASAEAEPKQLGAQLQALKQQLADLQKKYQQGAVADWQELKPLKQAVAQQKTAVYDQMVAAQEALEKQLKAAGSREMKDAFLNLQHVLRITQEGYVRLTRALNPVFGYIILGLLVGAPISRKLSRWLDERFPQLKQKHLASPFSKDLSALPGLYGKGTGHGGFGQQPTLVMPGIGSGVLH